MLEPMIDGDGEVLAVRARGVLTEEDYQDVLVPRLEAALEAADRVRVLVLMDASFRGWDARAAWLNTRLDIRHRRDFDKVAVVGAPAWERWCIKMAGLLIAGTIRTYEPHQLDDAWTWLRS